MARLRPCDPVNCIGPSCGLLQESANRKTDKTCARELKARARGGSIGSTSNPEATDSSRQRHGHRRPRAKQYQGCLSRAQTASCSASAAPGGISIEKK